MFFKATSWPQHLWGEALSPPIAAGSAKTAQPRLTAPLEAA
jgi:hypothetical protein